MMQTDSIVSSPVVPTEVSPVETDTAVVTIPVSVETPVTDSLAEDVNPPDTVIHVYTPPPIHRVVQDTVASAKSSAPPTADSLNVVHTYGVTLTAPKIPTVTEHHTDSFGMSIVTGILILLFCVIGYRFRNNKKYAIAVFRNLIDVRERTNVFDDTVRETSFIVMLNILWSCSAGVLLYGLLRYVMRSNPAASFGIPSLYTHPSASIAICMGVGVVYTCFMALAYYMVGTVFADKTKARLWLKGFTAGQGSLSLIYFFLALLLISHPDWGLELLWVAAGWLILAKIIFIWKGFRIFFTQISSWVLFLYYLCSLEIVPLILTYWAAGLLCSLL